MSAAPLKILVVDDEPPIRKLLRMGLSTQGYEVLEAPNGKASLDLLARNPASRENSIARSCCNLLGRAHS
jgi:two-component system, OmpR family, KDP operon response regulator KdpE